MGDIANRPQGGHLLSTIELWITMTGPACKKRRSVLGGRGVATDVMGAGLARVAVCRPVPDGGGPVSGDGRDRGPVADGLPPCG